MKAYKWLVVVIFCLALTIPSAFSWYDTNYLLRRSVTINNAGVAQTDFQTLINLTYDSDMSAGFDNLLMTWYNSTSGIEAQIPFCLGRECTNFVFNNGTLINLTTSNSSFTDIVVNVKSLPASSTSTIYIYYSNSTPVSYFSSSDTTWNFGDEFNDASFNTTKWSQPSYYNSGGTRTVNESGGVVNLTVIGPSGDYANMGFNSTEGYNASVTPLIIWNSVRLSRQVASDFGNSNFMYLRYGTWDFMVRYYVDTPYQVCHYVTCETYTISPDPMNDGKYHVNVVILKDAGIPGKLNDTTYYDGNKTFISTHNDTPNNETMWKYGIRLSCYDSKWRSANIDYVRVRKYSATEPTFAIGSEQNQTLNWISITPSDNVTYPAATNATCNPGVAWYYSSHSKRVSRVINNTANPNNLIDYQVDFDVSYDADMKTDFADLRFTWYNNTSGLEQPANFYVKNKVDSTYANLTVKIPFIAGNSTETIYMYYGNSSATSLSNGTNAYTFYDNPIEDTFTSFNQSSQWKEYNSGANTLNASTSNGYIQVNASTTIGVNHWIMTNSNFTIGKKFYFDNLSLGQPAVVGNDMIRYIPGGGFGPPEGAAGYLILEYYVSAAVKNALEIGVSDTLYKFNITYPQNILLSWRANNITVQNETKIYANTTTDIPTQEKYMTLLTQSGYPNETFVKVARIRVEEYSTPEPVPLSWSSEDTSPTFYRNGTLLGSMNDYVTLGAGVWNYTCKNGVDTDMKLLTVNTNSSGTVNLTITPSSPINYGTSSNATCSGNNPEPSWVPYLYRDNVLIGANETAILPAGTYNYTCAATATNYSAASTTQYYTVNKGNLYSNPTSLAMSLNAVTINKTGLIGYWRFESHNATNYTMDFSGNDNNGNCTGVSCPAGIVGKFGNAYSFDGNDDYVNFGNNSVLNYFNAMTISVWIKPKVQTTTQYIISKAKGSTYYNGYILAIRPINSDIRFAFFNGSATYDGCDISPTYTASDTWDNIVAVMNGTHCMIYKNGILLETGVYTGTVNMAGSPDLLIGKWNAAPTETFNGTIDEVSIWSKALTLNEIKLLYGYTLTGGVNFTTSVNDTGTSNNGYYLLFSNATNTLDDYAMYHAFDLNSGTTSKDMSLNDNDVTLTNVSWVSGKFGNALNFDGSGTKYADIPMTTSTNITGVNTISFWLKANTNSSIWMEILDRASDNILIQTQNYKMRYYLETSNGTAWLDSSGNVPQNIWTHYAMVYNGTHKLMYINGVLDTSAMANGTINSDGATWTLGAYYARNAAWYNGTIDELRIYPRALSQSEISTLYNATAIGVSDTASKSLGYYYYQVIVPETQNYTMRDQIIPMNITPLIVTIVQNVTSSVNYNQDYTIYPNFSIPTGGSTIPEVLSYVNGIVYENSSGLIGYWKLDSNANDNSGYGNDGTIVGAGIVAGKLGNALYFDGTDIVSIPQSSSLNLSTDQTLSAWVKYTTNGTNVRVIIEKRASGGSINYRMYETLAGLLGCEWYDGTSDIGAFSTTVKNDDQWHYTVCVRDSVNNRGYIYVDGVMNQNVSDTTVDANILNAGNLWFAVGGLGIQYFNGTIDDVKLYNRALSQSEVESAYALERGNGFAAGAYNITTYAPSTIDYVGATDSDTLLISKLHQDLTVSNGTHSINTSGLVGFWKFENDSLDYSGYENNGTCTNCPTLTSGRIGKSYQFDGLNDNILLSNANSIYNFTTQNFTISAWIKPQYNDGYATNRPIFVKSGSSGDYSYGFYSFCSVTCQTRLLVSTTGTDTIIVTSASIIPINSWSYVTAVKNGTHIVLYVNGVESGTPTAFTSIISDEKQEPYIGYGFGSSYYNGTIDEVTIWNRSLSSSEIQLLYQSNSYSPSAVYNYSVIGSGNPYLTQWNDYSAPEDYIGYWAMDTNTIAVDERRLNNGVFVNGTGLANGYFGSGVRPTNLTTQYTSLGNSSIFDFNNTFTTMAWVYPIGAVSGADAGIISKNGKNSTGSGIEQYHLTFFRNSTNTYFMSYAINTTGGEYWASADAYNITNLNTWYFVTQRLNGTHNCIWVNAVQYGCQPFYGSIKDYTSQGGNPNLVIGARNYMYVGSTSLRAFNGTIDEVKIYNRALTSAEIYAIYTATNKTQYNSLSSPSPNNYSFVAYQPESENYTKSSLSLALGINQANANVQVYPVTQTQTYPYSATQYCTSNYLPCVIYRNGTATTNNTVFSGGVGAYLFTANISDTQNYTNYEDSETLTITTNTSSVTLSITPATPITYETQSNATCTDTNPEASSGLYRNGTAILKEDGYYYDDPESATGYIIIKGMLNSVTNAWDDNWGSGAGILNYTSGQTSQTDIYQNYTLSNYSTTKNMYLQFKWNGAADGGGAYAGFGMYIWNFVSPGWDSKYSTSVNDGSYYDNRDQIINITLTTSDIANYVSGGIIMTKHSMYAYSGVPGSSASTTDHEQALNYTILTVGSNETAYLPAGVWNYTCNVSATENYTSSSTSQLYTVNKKNANVAAYPTTQSQVYEDTPLYRYCTDDSILNNCNIYQNNTLISNYTNPRLGVGVYTYNANISDTANYTNYQSATNTVTITQKNANVNVYPVTQSITYGNSVTQYCTDTSTLLNCVIYRNGTAITNNTAYLPAVGAYAYKANVSDAVNYTNYQDTETLTVTPIQLTVDLYLNGTKNADKVYSYSATNATGTISTNLDGLLPSLYRDGVYKGQSEYIFLPAGNYTYKVNATGNENYTSNSTGVSYKAYVVWAPQVAIQQPANLSEQYLYPNASKLIKFNYTTSDLYSTACWYSLDGGSTTALPGCSNTTLNITQYGNHSVRLYSNESYTGLTNTTLNNFYIDFINIWTIIDPSSNPLSGTAYFFNSTYSFNVSFNGTIYLNTSALPSGNMINVTITSPDKRTAYLNYNVTNETQIDATVQLLNSGMLIRVFGEDTLSPYNWWKVWMTNTTVNGTGSYTTQLSVGKGYPGTPFMALLDDDMITAISNSNANFTYNFGYTNAVFAFTYGITNAPNSYSNITLQAWNNTAGAWVTMMNISKLGNATKTTTNFTIDNSEGNAVFGDLTSLCNGYYCPLWQLTMQPAGSANISAYDMKLLSPYTYDTNGFAVVNYTNFILVSGPSRFRFESPVFAPGTYRTYFVSPSATATTTLDAYLNPNCHVQPFQVYVWLQNPSQTPIAIPNATLSIYKQIGSNSVLVDQQISNTIGAASLCVESGFPYSFSATAPGYSPEIVYDEVFPTSVQLIYVYLKTVSSNQNLTNPYYIYTNITPGGGSISTNTNYTCAALAPNGNALYSYYVVNRTPIYSGYPSVNISDYPPLFSNTSLPFGLGGYNNTTESNYYTGISYSPSGAIFSTLLNVTGKYTMFCGVVYYPYNETLVYTFQGQMHGYVTQTVWYTGTSLAPIGASLKNYISPTALYIVALIIDMMITGFFVVRFGVRSGFIFLIIWGFIITILSGWGLNVQSGIFGLGILFWLSLMVFPYRRD
jgi:hypothetical protein